MRHLLILLILLSSKLSAQEWVHLDQNFRAKSEYFLKRNSVSEESKTVWIKEVGEEITYFRKKAQKVTIKGSQLVLYRIDCDGRKMAIEEVITYDENNNAVSTLNMEAILKWDNVVPDTLMEAMFKKSCEELSK